MSKNTATVMLIIGRTGVGKSTLLDRLVKKHKGAIQLLRPMNLDNDFLDLSAVDWANHAAVVVDELGIWDRASIRSSIIALEVESQATGKKLILAAIGPDEFNSYGISLASKPVVFELKHPNTVSSLPLIFDGVTVHFKD